MTKLTIRLRTRAVAAALGLVAGVLGISAAPASATVTCPTVDPGTGAVSPPPVQNGDWSGCDLAGADMSAWKTYSLDLSGANLTNADMLYAQISGGNMTGANLTGANLTGASVSANLTGANLSGANLNSTSLAAANVSGAIMATATLTNVWTFNTTGVPASLPSGWEDIDSTILGPTANASQAILTGADLAGLDLDKANLGGTFLTGVDLTGTNLSNATLNYVHSGQIIGNPSLPAGWTAINGYLIGATANLNGASLAAANLAGMNLSMADLSAADLDGADLSNATLSGSYDGLQGPAKLFQTDLKDANLSGVLAHGANVTDADLTGASLTGSDLTNVNLADSDVSGADFSQATLTGLKSGGLTGTATLPANWAQAGGYILGPGASLPGATLAGLTLSGDDLAGADLTSADLTGTNLTSADLTNTKLTSANLTNADLELTTITGTDFTGVTWLNTTCPDGSNSNSHDAGCFTPLDTSTPAASPEALGELPVNGWFNAPVRVEWNWADPGTLVAAECPAYSTTTGNGPFTLTVTCTDLAGNTGTASYSGQVDATTPVVTVTGVASGHLYAIGHVPHPGCATTEAISGVGQAATLTISSGASHGIGPFTATCSGGTSVAGLPQKSPVSVQYAVTYGFSGFISPRTGSTIARSSRSLTVTFRLLTASGAPVSAATARSLAWAHHVRAELTGPGIKATPAWCSWRTSAKALGCTIRIPASAHRGSGYRYYLTVQETAGTGWHTAPVTGRIANPEVIHFR